MCEEHKEMYYPDGKYTVYGERLIHVHNRVTNEWAWMCSVCGKIMASHYCGKGKWQVLNTKGAASRHLETHGKRYVNHGVSIGEIVRIGHRVCKSCGYRTITIKGMDSYSSYLLKARPPRENHKHYCPICDTYKEDKETYMRKKRTI